jgi:hypothetical protein
MGFLALPEHFLTFLLPDCMIPDVLLKIESFLGGLISFNQLVAVVATIAVILISLSFVGPLSFIDPIKVARPWLSLFKYKWFTENDLKSMRDPGILAIVPHGIVREFL